MSEPLVPGRPGFSRADHTTAAVNRGLERLVISARNRPGLHVDVVAIGYGAHVRPLWPGTFSGREMAALSDLAVNPLRVTADADGIDRSIWLEPAADGPTPMVAAFTRVESFVTHWISQYPAGHPPVVLHVTDGASTDGDPRAIATRLRTTATLVGQTQLFNAHVGFGPTLWHDLAGASVPDPLADTLFQMSSSLPVEAARRCQSGQPRGFVFNADGDDLDSFIQIGTALEVLA